MLQNNPFGLAVLIIIIGLIFYLIVYWLLKAAPRPRMRTRLASLPGSANLVADHGDAVLVVETGGRVRSVNARASQIFHLQEGETPNLERLARKARPGDALLRLCAAEGQASFVLDGRLLEGTSYFIRAENNRSLAVVSLRYPEITSSLSGGQVNLNAQTLQTFTQLTQDMAASLDLDETLQAILENVEKLMPADFMEVTVWDAESAYFIPYRFVGLPGVERQLELSNDRYHPGQGFTGLLFQERKPLVIADIEAREDLRPAFEKMAMPLKSYLGLPLMVGSEFIGTLELGSMAARAFRDEDLDIVRLLSGQAAIAVHNALLYRVEQQRTAELTGLAQLAQAFGSVRDPASVFSRLVESIAPLLEVEVIGFLVYNESRRVLEARAPFHGLPDPIVELYQTQIRGNTAAEKILLDQDVLITEDAAEDEKWVQLGIGHIAQAASLHETVLVPLSTGGHTLGYLQVSNHTNGRSPFTKAELHLLMILANQTASIIENVSLVQQSRHRAMRAEALRRITSLIASSANLDEILQYSVQELARLLRADGGALFLLDQEQGALTLHRPSVFGQIPSLSAPAASLMVDDLQYHFTVTGSQHALALGNASQGGQAIVPFYQSILKTWGVESVVITPLVVQNAGIGELWFGSRSPEFFEQGDAQVIMTAAGQLAAAVEQAHLRGQTDETLRRRVDQLTAINRISRELSTSLDLNFLLNLVYDESLRTARADCGTIKLFDLENPRGADPAIRFFVGDMPDADPSPLELRVLETDTPQVVSDFSRSEYQPPHPGIQSALVVPISYQQRIGGLICLHGKSTGQFDKTAVEISQSLAVQAAVVLNNALAYEEQTRRGAILRREIDTLSRLTQVSRVLKPGQSLEQSLFAIARAIQSATPFQAVVISSCDPDTQVLSRIVGLGLSPVVWEEMQLDTQPWSGVQKLLQPEFQVGATYYIPKDKTPVIPPEVHVVSVLPALEIKAEGSWQPEDMLLIPLYDAGMNPVGLISVDAPSDNRRPDRPTFEALEMFATQSSILLDSHRRAGQLERQLEEVSREKTRLEQSAIEAQSNLPMMLHKELEQSIALRGYSQQIERIQASLEIATVVNRQENEGAVLHTLANELLTRFAMQVALIAVRAPGGISLVETIGNFPPGTNPEALFGQRNPLRHMLQQYQPGSPESALLLAATLDATSEWHNNILISALEGRSMIGMSLELSDHRLGGILVIGQRALQTFQEADRRVLAQLAHQVSVGLQNLQLFNETRRRLKEVNLVLDFSRKLGGLTPDKILAALVENIAQVLPHANAGWVGMWEEKDRAIVPQAAVGYASSPDLLAIRYRGQESAGEDPAHSTVMPLRVFQTGRAERVDEINFATQYHLAADDLMHYRKATGGRLPISVMCVPLRVGEAILGVVFFENFDTPDTFTVEDEALAASFTRQAAMALENARLFQASERRATQLQALTKVAGTITSSLQRDALVSSLLDQLKVVLPYDTATLWLRAGSQLSVSAATGFAEEENLLNITVAVQDSELFKAMVQSGEPILVGDVRNDPRFSSLIEAERLSWLGIPLMYKSEVIGLIALEKREADFYTPDSVQAATAFASQAAVSLENARLYEESNRRATELDERSQRLALLNRLSGELVSSLDIDHIFRLTGQQLLSALQANGVASVMIDPQGVYVLQGEIPTPGETQSIALAGSPFFDRLQDSQGIFQTSNAAAENELAGLWQVFLQARGVRSLLVVPLISGSTLQGWFLIYRATEYRYGPPEIELARTICNQSAIAIQNARLFAETRRLTEDLERRVDERTGEVRREHQNSQTLLHIITELSTSLDIGLVLNRTLSVLNDSVGCEESMIILSHGSAAQYRAGEQLAGMTEDAGSLERQIAGWVIRSRQPVVIGAVQADGRWEIPPQAAIGYRSVIAVPLVMGEEVLGALLLFHRAQDFFSQHQIGLMEATARQIGIALNNAELFNLIRDQSEHLGGMLRDQQIEASRSRAILEAVADGVLVTDAGGRVTLFNVSGERILGLKSSQVIGRSLDHFSGLFGKTAVEWMRTITGWSKDPSISQEAETYAEQLSLDNGRVVAVHLAPVFWRQEYLGTVSIFRDITHEVQVDRLKSEFVANVSHELRTPMTSIKGYVEIMLMGAAGELSPRQNHFLNIVKSNTERLSVLVNDLLDISRIESGRVSFNLQALDIREIAEDVLAEYRRRARDENRQISFLLDAHARLPFAQGDMERVRQVLSNLVSNGYNYTPESGCVTVGIQENAGEIQVDVRDNGIGIEPDAQSRIFERFYRGDDPLVLASAGTGLGLPIAKTLVEMHNGRIWFESSGERGTGSIFSFTLPVYESQ